MSDTPDQPSADGRTRTPPYISFKTLLTFLDDQKQHGLPNRIDRSVLTKFSGGVGSQLLAALKFGGLIEANHTSTTALAELVEAHQTDEWKPVLGKFIRRAYGPIVAHDLQSLTPAQFHELFKKHYPASDEVVRKCETFFITAATAADIPINKRITKFRSPRASSAKRRPNGSDANAQPEPGSSGRQGGSERQTHKRSAAQPSGEPNPSTAPHGRSPYEMLIEVLDPSKMDETEMAAVWTLIRYLKRRDADD
jgi:hypothetical protein